MSCLVLHQKTAKLLRHKRRDGFNDTPQILFKFFLKRQLTIINKKQDKMETNAIARNRLAKSLINNIIFILNTMTSGSTTDFGGVRQK